LSIEAALRHATYETLPDDGTFFGTIPGFPGVWANAETREECRDELAEVLEGWLLLGIANHERMPVVNGVDINVKRAVGAATVDVA